MYSSNNRMHRIGNKSACLPVMPPLCFMKTKVDGRMAHHIIKHGLDASTEIWRYLSVEKFALLISRRRLWFTRADLLGDEHEGSVPDSIIVERQQRLNDDRVRAIIERGAKEGTKTCLCHLLEHAVTRYALNVEDIYTPNGTGIVVKTTIGRLAGCFISKPNDFFYTHNARIEKVNYINFISHDATPDTFDPFTHKQAAYCYEKEIRAIISFMPTVERAPIGRELEVDLDLLIDSVYVSHRLGDGLERFVQNLLLEKDLKKEVIHPPFVREPKY